MTHLWTDSRATGERLNKLEQQAMNQLQRDFFACLAGAGVAVYLVLKFIS